MTPLTYRAAIALEIPAILLGLIALVAPFVSDVAAAQGNVGAPVTGLRLTPA